MLSHSLRTLTLFGLLTGLSAFGGTITTGTIDRTSSQSAGSQFIDRWILSGTTSSGGTFSIDLNNDARTGTFPTEGESLCAAFTANPLCPWTLPQSESTWTMITNGSGGTFNTSSITWNGVTYNAGLGSIYTTTLSRTISVSGSGIVQPTASCFGPVCNWVFPSGAQANFVIAVSISNGATTLVSETLTGVATMTAGSALAGPGSRSSSISWAFANTSVPEPGTWATAGFALAGLLAAAKRRSKQ